VKVDTVYGNNATQTIRLHWNNGAAASESNGAAVFDTANGFRGVWHLQDSTGAKSTDATVLNTNASWVNAPVLVDGLIGRAVNINQPDGVDPTTAKFLRADYNPANSNFKISSANGLTLSVWVKRNASTGGNEQGILGRYNWGANARQAMIATNGSDQIRLFRSINGTNASGQETNFGTQSLIDGEWTHIAATVKNGSQILYVNGVQDVAQTTANIGSLDSIWATTSTLAFGHMAPDHGSTTANQAFNGVLDEARYTGAFRSADWIKLEVANQKAVNSLINIGLPTAPGAPTAVTGVSGNQQVTLTWIAPASNGGISITSYKAMAVSDSTKTCTSASTSCVIAGLTNGTAYTFTVRATNPVGSSALSTASAAVTPNPVVPSQPNVPSASILNTTTGAVTVSWTAPFNGGSAITGYTVTGTPSGSCTTTSAVTCTITGLTVGTVYTFTVKATNAVGQSPASLSSNAVTAATSIAPAGSLLFNVGHFTKAYSFQLSEAAQKSTEALTLSVSDASGKTVWARTIHPSESRVGTLAWNGLTSTGAKVSAGVYIARVRTAGASGSQETIQAGVKLRQD
jgi:hypothetical protein